MRKYWKTFVISIISCMIFSACGSVRAAEPARLNLVSRVDVSYRNYSFHLSRSYTSPDKMDAILFFLYDLGSEKKPADDPEKLPPQRCTVTVTLNNGDTHIYHLIGGTYLFTDRTLWQRIDPEQSARLFPLLARMCSDAE